MITFRFWGFPFVVCVPHTVHFVNDIVTDIILNITSQEHLIFTLLHIGSRLFELFSKEEHVKKQPGRPLNQILRIGRVAQLKEHWTDDLEVAGSTLLYATIFLPTMVAFWHTPLQLETYIIHTIRMAKCNERNKEYWFQKRFFF